MLCELSIRNFAIIDRLQVRFGLGFNVLTGETGAGKSIIIDAVGLLLGDRARPELIRTGEEEATVEALFDLNRVPALRAELAEQGFEDGGELLVKRVVARSGKNRVYLNGSLAKLGQLQPLTAQLLAIYGQHEHQNLQKPEQHLVMLDDFAALTSDLEAYQLFFREQQGLESRLQQLNAAERERRQRLDLLAFQSRELAAAALRPGEDEELLAERLLLQHAERLALATAGGYELLYGGEGAVVERLDAVASQLEALVTVDPRLGSWAEGVRSALFTLEDVAAGLRDYQGEAFEPGRQAEVEERLALLTSLKRKYAPTIGEILALQAGIEAELHALANVEATREELQQQLSASRQRLLRAGEELGLKRREAALRLASAVERELRALAMPKARFEVRFFPLAEPGAKGLERGEFYLSPNPGEETKPLAWIASGGELSRIMLSLKRVAPAGDGVPTQIFDEVDAGIGGVAATAVGEKLHAVAAGQQVLCITHLPQVAAFADRHYRVEKREQEGRTRTELLQLADADRVQEMARMLGGAQITERTLEHARELIRLSAGAGANDFPGLNSESVAAGESS